ncbi:MAG TPA: iron-containing alcohol dehydrogenase [Thermoanaerobaculia bacterium]|nr:iron-containing alcohol dehydrogenase [Thermoanaerobaculia bacterium]
MRFRVPQTLLFGRGQLAEVPAVLVELGVEKPLIVTDPGVAAVGLPERLQQSLAEAGLASAVWDGVEPDPGEEHADACRGELLAGAYDSVIALGGGSVIDVAKVAAVLATNGGALASYFGFDRVRRQGLPLLTVPTISGSGAEVSSHAVIRERVTRKKEVVSGTYLVPRAAVVDPAITRSLPPTQTAWSALDGFIHAVEAFLARRSNPFTDAFARMAVPAIARALPRVLADGADLTAREDLSLGCLYAGLAMANANAGAIHALGYPLTGRYGIPHGLANALVAAAALERIGPGRPERAAELARLIGNGNGVADLAHEVRQLLTAVQIEDRLSSWGVQEDDLPSLAEAATHFRPVLENTPVLFAEADLLSIYRAVWA